MKQNPLIKELTLYGIKRMKGIPSDVSHIDTSPIVKGYGGPDEVSEACLDGHRKPDNVFGLTAVDSVRANTLLARLKGLDSSTVKVPVIGGHSDGTDIPLFSQATPKNLNNHNCKLSNMFKQDELKVAIAGAAGGVGQATSLLLKHNPLIKELALYDIKGIRGVALEVSHIDTSPIVKGYQGPDEISEAFLDAHLIIFAAGVPRQAGTKSSEELFNANAEMVKSLANAAAAYSPTCIIVVITSPVNSCVPMIRIALEKAGHRKPDNVFGSTAVDLVRANTLLARLKGLDPSTVKVPVIGGHSDGTIIPLFSQATPKNLNITPEEVKELTDRVLGAGGVVFKLKGLDIDSTTILSAGYAACKLCSSILRGLKGDKDIVDTAYVKSSVVPGVKYFSSPLVLGKTGIEKFLELGSLSEYEQSRLQSAIPILNEEIKLGEGFMRA